MDNNKAPGCSYLIADMLKNLLEEGINFLTNLISQYWINEECQIGSWNIQQLVSLYKGKGDMQNLNNCRYMFERNNSKDCQFNNCKMPSKTF